MNNPNKWGLLWSLLLVWAVWPGQLEALITRFTREEAPDWGEPLWRLLLTHLGLVLGAELAVVVVGLGLAVLLTRSSEAAPFRVLVEGIAGLGQTIPTIALLALAVPILGLGVKPALLGLFLYGLMPVISSAISGLSQVPSASREAARGMGMSHWQQLVWVEWPLALPLIVSGIRVSTVYNVGTATVAAALGAGGLGLPLINGLSQQNSVLVWVGALLCALLALSLDGLLGVWQQGQQSYIHTEKNTTVNSVWSGRI